MVLSHVEILSGGGGGEHKGLFSQHIAHFQVKTDPNPPPQLTVINCSAASPYTHNTRAHFEHGSGGEWSSLTAI